VRAAGIALRDGGREWAGPQERRWRRRATKVVREAVREDGEAERERRKGCWGYGWRRRRQVGGEEEERGARRAARLGGESEQAGKA